MHTQVALCTAFELGGGGCITPSLQSGVSERDLTEGAGEGSEGPVCLHFSQETSLRRLAEMSGYSRDCGTSGCPSGAGPLTPGTCLLWKVPGVRYPWHPWLSGAQGNKVREGAHGRAMEAAQRQRGQSWACGT